MNRLAKVRATFLFSNRRRAKRLEKSVRRAPSCRGKRASLDFELNYVSRSCGQ